MNEYTEYRIVGPPGTGKTTDLARQVGVALRAGKAVAVTSLTRAAAAEVAGRDLHLEKGAVGTLHSMAYHALNGPAIGDTPEMLKIWNEDNPYLALTIPSGDKMEDNAEGSPLGGAPGDSHFQQMNLYRSRMIPRDNWVHADTNAFAEIWDQWKVAHDFTDFTGMIEDALKSVPSAPLQPDIMFVDEAQDMDTLEMALIRKWALEAGALVVVGDPDQCLYQWRGADPRVFYSANIPDSHAHVLKQSYRVPRSVHRLAMDWISQDPERVPVEYYPRDAEGVVRRSSASWALPETLVRDAQEQIEAGRTVMFLASCSYMLFPLIACLHRHGLPYHNPYRRTAWKWNPLQTARGRTTSAERLLAFVELAETGQYSRDSLVRWTGITLKKPTFKERGEDWLEFVDTRWVTMDDLDLILSDEAMDAALMGDTNWLYQNLLAQRKRGMGYPITIYDAHGRDMLMKTPQITVGTIHSVKGGEADVVYLFPDLSGAGAAEWDRERSPIRRLFYVGMTRAKEELILCEPKDNNAVNL